MSCNERLVNFGAWEQELVYRMRNWFHFHRDEILLDQQSDVITSPLGVVQYVSLEPASRRLKLKKDWYIFY